MIKFKNELMKIISINITLFIGLIILEGLTIKEAIIPYIIIFISSLIALFILTNIVEKFIGLKEARNEMMRTSKITSTFMIKWFLVTFIIQLIALFAITSLNLVILTDIFKLSMIFSFINIGFAFL